MCQTANHINPFDNTGFFPLGMEQDFVNGLLFRIADKTTGVDNNNVNTIGFSAGCPTALKFTGMYVEKNQEAEPQNVVLLDPANSGQYLLGNEAAFATGEKYNKMSLLFHHLCLILLVFYTESIVYYTTFLTLCNIPIWAQK